MKPEGKGKLLRIFINESNRQGGEPLYHAIVKRMHQEGLAGITVIRGVEGFGANRKLRNAKILELAEDLPVIAEDLPVILEIVDTAEKIAKVRAILDTMIEKGLMVVVRDVEMVKYTPASNVPSSTRS